MNHYFFKYINFNKKMSEEKIIKVIFLGCSGVGKTNLIQVAMDNPFQEKSESTFISSFYENEIIIQDKKYMYTLWDTAGQEEYRSLNKSFIINSKIIFIVFAVNDRKSFEEVDFWIKYVNDILEKGKYIMALVANKSDLIDEQEIPDEEIMKKGEELGIKVKITSALEDAIGFKIFLKELLKDFVKSGIGFEVKKSFSLQPELIEEGIIGGNKNNESENSNRRNSTKKKNGCC